MFKTFYCHLLLLPSPTPGLASAPAWRGHLPALPVLGKEWQGREIGD
ncbi:MAG: hypothetical protein KDE56_08010 [Anaerolineales bacterium]|nr:hypothetical protein [Anaerolineales bacterium]